MTMPNRFIGPLPKSETGSWLERLEETAREHDLLLIPAPVTAIHWEFGLIFLATFADARWVVEQIAAIVSA
jgi:hypothetical protein